MGIRNARRRERRKNGKKSKEKGLPVFSGAKGITRHGKIRLASRLPSGEHLPSLKKIKKAAKAGKFELGKSKFKKRKVIIVDGHRVVTDKKMTRLITYIPA